MTEDENYLSALLTAMVLACLAIGQELDGTLKKIKTSVAFTLGYRESAPPFFFSGPDRRPVGQCGWLADQLLSLA